MDWNFHPMLPFLNLQRRINNPGSMKNLTLIFVLSFLLLINVRGQDTVPVVMNFDSIADFSLQFSPWRAVDLDSSNTYGFQTTGFPHNTFPMAFIAFNPSHTTPPMTTDTAIFPHSAPRFGACFSATTPPNNDWFISPAIHLNNNGEFSCWVKSYTNAYGLEKYRVAVSVTDSNPSSFTVISGPSPLEAPVQWTRKTFSLSAYNNQKVFVAIQCVSSDVFIFMIDDLVINPGSVNPEPSYLFEDFEGFADFTLDLSPWTVADIKGGITYGIDAHSFPHSGEPMAYIAFNPSQVTPAMTTPGILPHSGSRFAGCFASAPNFNPNNKWLISPRIQLGSNSKIGLWVETFNPEYGMEKYNICVSTATNNPSDFVIVSGSQPLSAPIDWAYKVTDLSAYNEKLVYVGIQCVSDNTFLFMVDDVEIGSTVGINEAGVNDPVRLYPMPASDRINIDFGGWKTGKVQVTLLGISGQEIRKYPIFDESGLTTLALPALAPGMYYLVILTDQGRLVKKLIIK